MHIEETLGIAASTQAVPWFPDCSITVDTGPVPGRAPPWHPSARRLHVVVVQPEAKPGRQGAADDDHAGRHAVLSPVKNVPDEHGGGQGGQEAGADVQVAGPGQAGVRADPVERHEPNDQDETCKREPGVGKAFLCPALCAPGAGEEPPGGGALHGPMWAVMASASVAGGWAVQCAR